jgi:excisionase family DNA binding protein
VSDDQFEIGSVSLTRPQWWWDHSDEFDEVMRVAADWDAAAQVERRLPDAEEPEVEPPTPRRLTLTVEEAAETLGISRAFAYESVRRGDIPSIRIGRRILVPKVALERMLDGDVSADEGC